MSVWVEMFRISDDPKKHRCYHPMLTDNARRSRRAKSYDRIFRTLHKKYKHVFENATLPMAKYVLPTDVPVNGMGYFVGWFFTNKLYNVSYPEYIAFTKKEAERMFRDFIDWKKLPFTDDHSTAFDTFPETFSDVRDVINDMLDKFEDGKTFITFTCYLRK